MFFDESRPDRKKRAQKRDGFNRRATLVDSPVPPAKVYELMTLAELYSGKDRTLVFDSESYWNYFLVAFRCLETKKVIYFEDSPDCIIDRDVLGFILNRFTIVGFNSSTYDMPIMALALNGCHAETIKQASNELIKENMRPYELERKYWVRTPKSDHIDIIEVAPIQASLKIYAGRLGCQRMQDLPYPEDTILTPHQAINVRDYCINDLDNTELLYEHLLPHIQLRELLGKEYGLDLRSKSDAQVAEAVIKEELKRVGIDTDKIKYNGYQPGDSFNYIKPEFINFKTPVLRNALDVVCSTPFHVGNGGSADCPEIIDNLKPKLGNCIYRLGVGGLHSNEKSVAYYADSTRYIIDRDGASYYPFIILNNGFYPKQLGKDFLDVFRNLVLRRLKLKKEKNPLEAGLKIAINGIIGKLGNLYSFMYSPDMLLQVCMTGQLSLLMLIESIELVGISILSANTDGIVIDCPRDRYKELCDIITMWEEVTGFNTEETFYEAIASRDVNNYITVKTKMTIDENTKEPIWHHGVKDECKTKGFYSTKGSAQNSVLSKNPESYVVSMAIQEFMARDTSLDQTIKNCKNLKHFLNVRTVKGGAEKDGVFLGKAIRWYYACNEKGTINYVESGNKVPKSDGAKPLMNLPTDIPADLDYDYYHNEAINQLFELGIYKRPETARLL